MRVFFPLIFVYALLLWGGLTLAFHSATPWTDRRFFPALWRLILYPAVMLTILMVAFAAAARVIDYGWYGTQFALPLVAIVGVLALIKLAIVMVGDVRKILHTPTKEIQP